MIAKNDLQLKLKVFRRRKVKKTENIKLPYSDTGLLSVCHVNKFC